MSAQYLWKPRSRKALSRGTWESATSSPSSLTAILLWCDSSWGDYFYSPQIERAMAERNGNSSIQVQCHEPEILLGFPAETWGKVIYRMGDPGAALPKSSFLDGWGLNYGVLRTTGGQLHKSHSGGWLLLSLRGRTPKPCKFYELPESFEFHELSFLNLSPSRRNFPCSICLFHTFVPSPCKQVACMVS